MSPPRAILFDLGETLIHFPGADRSRMFEDGARAGHAYLRSQGLPLPPVNEFVRSMLWRGRKAMLINRISRRELDVAALFGLAVGNMKPRISPETWQQYILRMYEPLEAAAQLDPQAVAVLSRLHQAGLKVALVSNTFVPQYAVDAHLERLGLLELFDYRFFSAEVGLKKPSLALFRHAVRTLGIVPGDIWHVGDDVLADVLGARRAGLTSVLRLHPGERPLGRHVPWWWPIKPRYVIHQLDELLDLIGV